MSISLRQGKRIVRGALAVTLAAAGAVAIAPAAHGSSIQGDAFYLSYEASPGEENDVRVLTDISGNLVIREWGPGVTIQDFSALCTVSPSGREATCAGVPEYLSTSLGDLDDKFSAFTAAIPASSIINADGGDGNDTLVGGAIRDQFTGGLGADDLNGAGGRDSLEGGPDADTLDGRAGSDFVGGGSGNDAVVGGSGIDELSGGYGDDELDGGIDDDVLHADPGSDLFEGGDGFDVASYGDRDDPVNVTIGAGIANDGNAEDGPAGARDDVLATVEGVDGGMGADRLVGDAGDNELLGMFGSDVLLGGGGNDGLEGAAGRDQLTGGVGTDSLDGGRDNDALVTQDGAPDDADCGGGTDTADADAKDTVAGDCETVN